jgi:putative spermidine/putrescine transport system permease protein
MKNSSFKSRLFIILVIIYMLVPLAATIVYSLFNKWTGILPQNFTVKYYIDLLSDSNFLMALLRTIIISIVPIFITVILVLFTLFITLVYLPKFDKLLQVLCMIPYMIQGVILSVSIISLYAAAPGFLGNRVFLLIGAYCIIILPHIYQGIKNAMGAINMNMLLEATEMLGASKLYGFFKVIIPNILSGITISALLSAGIIFGDYVLIRNIAGTSFQNVQVYLFLTMKSSSTKASAVFVIIMLTTFIISFIGLSLQNKINRAETKSNK